jgi:hypothetical protein
LGSESGLHTTDSEISNFNKGEIKTYPVAFKKNKIKTYPDLSGTYAQKAK